MKLWARKRYLIAPAVLLGALVAVSYACGESVGKIAGTRYRLRTVDQESLASFNEAIDLVNQSLGIAGESLRVVLVAEDKQPADRPGMVGVYTITPAGVPGNADLFTLGDPAIYVCWNRFVENYRSEIAYLRAHREAAIKQVASQLDRLPESIRATAREELDRWRVAEPSLVDFLYVGLLHELGHIKHGHGGEAGLLLHAEDLAIEKGRINAAEGDDAKQKELETEADAFAARVISKAANTDEIGLRVADAMNNIYLLGRVEAHHIADAHMRGDALKLFDTDYQHECRTLRLLRMHLAILKELQMNGLDAKSVEDAIKLIERLRREYEQSKR